MLVFGSATIGLALVHHPQFFSLEFRSNSFTLGLAMESSALNMTPFFPRLLMTFKLASTCPYVLCIETMKYCVGQMSQGQAELNCTICVHNVYYTCTASCSALYSYLVTAWPQYCQPITEELLALICCDWSNRSLEMEEMDNCHLLTTVLPFRLGPW